MSVERGFHRAHCRTLGNLLRGDQLKVHQANGIIKCHIHTNSPEYVINAMESMAWKSDIVKLKIFDLHNNLRNTLLLLPDLTLNNTKAKVQVVYTSVTEAPDYLNSVAMQWCIPFRTYVDHERYLDNISISSVDCANLARREVFQRGKFNCADGADEGMMRSILGRALEMTKDRNILLILPPKHVSLNTTKTAEHVLNTLSPDMRERVTIHHTMFVSAPGSDDVATAFEMAADGSSVDEIVSKLESRRNDVCLLTCLNSVEPLVQSGRMKDGFSTKLQRKAGTKLLGYMPLPSECDLYPETRLIRKHFGEGATTVVKIGTASSWEALMMRAFVRGYLFFFLSKSISILLFFLFVKINSSDFS